MTHPPKFNLIIRTTVDNELYAVTEAFNGKTIWKTSESYKTKVNIIKAIRYLRKPDRIIIDIPNLTPRRREGLYYSIKSI